jgi:hypothetical protein
MTLSSKQLAALVGVLATGLAAMAVAKDAMPYIAVVTGVSLAALLFAGSGAGAASLQGHIEAARRAAAGEKPSVPSDATGDALRLYEALAALSEQRRGDLADLGARPTSGRKARPRRRPLGSCES